MRKFYLAISTFILVLLTTSALFAQVPELMYFQFNTASGSSVNNDAQTGTKVSTTGTLTALTLTTGGQFNSALSGNGGVSSSNNFNSGASLNLSGPWTISMWFSGVTNALSSNYMFGDAGGVTFRALTGSGVVAGAGNLEIRATGMTDVFLYNVFDAIGTPVVCTYVYDPTIPAIKGYINGVLSTTVSQPNNLVLTGGSGFLIGGYGSNNCLPSGAKLDEFRMYNRALSATEISNTWNIDLLASTCSAPTGLAAGSVSNNSASLTWNSVAGSIGYEYVLDQTLANPSGSGTLVSTTNYNASGLNPNTTYYIHVRNKCSASSFSSWVTTSFTTQNFVSCSAPAVASVVPTSTSTAILSWSPVPGTTGYEYVINQNSGNPAGNGTPLATTSTTLAGLTSGASYYVHVRNVCSPVDKSVWLHQQFTMPVCNTPTNVLISNITDSTTDLLWSQMPNASGYDYAADFSKLPPTTYKNSNGFAAHLSGLVPNSKYYLHVRSRCFAADTSAWRLDSFVTLMVCYAPIVQVNGLGTNTPYSFWDPIPTAVGYEYTLTNTTADPAFGNPIYTPFTGLTLPDDGKDYYLHVRTKCNSMFTFSQWSTVALRTGMTDIPVVTSSGVEVYPNPVNEVLYVKKALAGTKYSIVDMAGRVLVSDVIRQDNQQINASHLPAGIYLFRLNDETLTQVKFVKL
ncbi:T9SS type A sorting domain-containing protein [Polluticoccus soli]|uniref:T9SS type A sorting domain-containing protein n=1 Tax=Polluticoccus soli TaxID=3034150 RepID=UPI0023E299C4|nr:T9SS type A sorting domain-containing protein [Flavipsychrobacter sp. JY13-12]